MPPSISTPCMRLFRPGMLPLLIPPGLKVPLVPFRSSPTTRTVMSCLPGPPRPIIISLQGLPKTSTQVRQVLELNINQNAYRFWLGFTTDAKTSCQRRFCIYQAVDGLSVESIFILHGTVIFACHSVESPVPKSDSTHVSLKRPMPAESYYDVSHSPNSFRRPRLSPSSSASRMPASPLNSSIRRINHAASSLSGSTRFDNQTDPTEASNHSAHYRKSPSRSPESLERQENHQNYTTSSDPIRRDPYVPTTTESERVHAEYYPTSGDLSRPYIPNSSSSRSTNENSISQHQAGQHGGLNPSTSTSSGVRVAGNPPPGVSRCISCKTTVSPEWRKGPSGKKELCNA